MRWDLISSPQQISNFCDYFLFYLFVKVFQGPIVRKDHVRLLLTLLEPKQFFFLSVLIEKSIVVSGVSGLTTLSDTLETHPCIVNLHVDQKQTRSVPAP